ncbi:biotin synthase [Cantharellus anzutake]|uniref:biotin synthase n=1 Tax=Cantharellus anzutake TaxID=1750568 RepID=UPI0019081C69|nr:biotin synthase [Cantharellus anzutake]KAF8334249.1 biotin synthase [Cantharellus anzutake]
MQASVLRRLPISCAVVPPGRLLFSRGHATTIEHSGGDSSTDASQGSLSDNSKRFSKREISDIYHSPLLGLVYRAASVHAVNHDPTKVQLCTLLNIKSGGCTEDCSYCSQSSRYKTATKSEKLLQVEPVLEAARKAKANGSTRFCMGAAWRDLQGRKSGFERNNIPNSLFCPCRGMGMEVCTTLGMLSPEQAQRLKEAGLTAYNHNLDTSREYYPKVITTRSYDERLETINAVRDAGISVCSGGILGLGESDVDRVGLLWEASNMHEHPESFPVNALVPIPGTPLEKNPPLQHDTILRTIATARVVMPTTIIRLAAGRQSYSEAEQALCFMAGANAIFTGDAMLTTPCSPWDQDKAMLNKWGLKGMASFDQQSIRTKERSFIGDATPHNSTDTPLGSETA